MAELPEQPDEHDEETLSPEDAITIRASREMLGGGSKDPMIGLKVG